MDPVGYNLPPFAPSSNQGQIPQPAQGVNLNAMVVRPKISTPASALEAERRRVHPSKFSCDYCPDKFTSKANRNRKLLRVTSASAILLTRLAFNP